MAKQKITNRLQKIGEGAVIVGIGSAIVAPLIMWAVDRFTPGESGLGGEVE